MEQIKDIFIDELTKQNIARALWMKEYREDLIPKDLLVKIKSEKNGNSAFSSRFTAYLRQLMDGRMTFIPSRARRYQMILEHAKALSPQQCYANLLFIGPESVAGYEPIPANPTLNWPQIDSPQWKNQVGWHFFVGNFSDGQNHHYSVQLMFWQYALLPPPLAISLGLSEMENQIVEMHLAVSDPQTGVHYRADTVVAAGTTGLIGFTPKPYAYTLGKNSISSSAETESLFPVRLRARGWDMGKRPDAEIEIDLSLKNESGYFLEGEDGCAPSIDGLGTLYYSAANLKLEEKRDNIIMINGRSVKPTAGSMWYDHQWGTGFMPAGAPRHAVMRAAQNLAKPAPGGWDWFMAQFHENAVPGEEGEVQITLSALHKNNNLNFYWQTGPTPPGIITASFFGKYINAKNQTKDVKGTMRVDEWTKITASPNPALYPPTNTWYPARFQFTVAENVPDAVRQFTLTPIIASGQTGFFATGLQYGEGGAVVTNSAGSEIGRGFAESTNYAMNKEAIIKLAGLPVDARTLTFFSPPKVSLWLRIVSFIYMLSHKRELKRILAEAKGMSFFS